MFNLIRKISREDFLLYVLFFLTTLGRHVEPYAIVGWMIIYKQTGRCFGAMWKLMPLFAYLLISSVVGFAITQFPMDMFIEQMAQLVVYMSIYYAMMEYYNGRYEHVFEVFCNFCFILAICALLQYATARFLGMQLFTGLRGRDGIIGDLTRAQAWMGEASYCALYLTPAIVYNSLVKGIENYKSLTMIAAGYFAFSPVFKLVLVLFLIFYFVHNRVSLRKIFLYSFAFFAINYVSGHYTISEYDADDMKRSETLEYWGASFSELETANLSTYSLLKNLKIARMADNRITGTGLGSHGYSHDKFYHSSFEFSFLNKNDAFSLGTRLYSEMGIVGIVLFVFFFLRGYNKNSYINISILFYILYAFCRGGHYTIFGLQFFIMMFYFTSKFKNYYQYETLDCHSGAERK